MQKITSFSLNQETRLIHVYYKTEIVIGNKIHIIESSETFDEDKDFENNENWGNKYIEQKLEEKIGSPVETATRLTRLPL
jgi:hypothetical protein